LHFGLGGESRARATVYWPSGAVEVFDLETANRIVPLKEGTGRAAGSQSVPQ